MRIARVSGTDGVVYLARLDAEVATPILAEDARPGSDPLRDALAASMDMAIAPAVAAPAPLSAWKLLAPVVAPQKVLAIGLNYGDHARETGAKLPDNPMVFAKLPSSVVGPGDTIRYSKSDSQQVDYEAELAVVLGRRARHVDIADALEYVLGYTLCNDVSARDAQFADKQWVRSKSFDTFCPLGPWIVTSDEIPDPQKLPIATRVNGRTLQDSSTAEMVFGVAALVSYISQTVTLEPGDVIATGTPSGVGFTRTPPVFLSDGDVVEIEIDRIGVLRNDVAVES